MSKVIRTPEEHIEQGAEECLSVYLTGQEFTTYKNIQTAIRLETFDTDNNRAWGLLLGDTASHISNAQAAKHGWTDERRKEYLQDLKEAFVLAVDEELRANGTLFQQGILYNPEEGAN